MVERINIKRDKRGFVYNSDYPWVRHDDGVSYSEYVKTYTDLEFKADVFLRYMRHFGDKNNLDKMMEAECRRRFGVDLDDIYSEIIREIDNRGCAYMIFSGEIDSYENLELYKRSYDSDGGEI